MMSHAVSLPMLWAAKKTWIKQVGWKQDVTNPAYCLTCSNLSVRPDFFNCPKQPTLYLFQPEAKKKTYPPKKISGSILGNAVPLTSGYSHRAIVIEAPYPNLWGLFHHGYYTQKIPKKNFNPKYVIYAILVPFKKSHDHPIKVHLNLMNNPTKSHWIPLTHL